MQRGFLLGRDSHIGGRDSAPERERIDYKGGSKAESTIFAQAARTLSGAWLHDDFEEREFHRDEILSRVDGGKGLTAESGPRNLFVRLAR